MSKDKKAQRAIEGASKKMEASHRTPAAGPHATEQLTDESKTPGTGMLTQSDDAAISPSSG